MEKLELNLENCYGIKKLNETIEFKKIDNQTGLKKDINACLIYASNGTMKTSFANTFLDIENERETKDRIEPNNNTIRNIKIDGKDISRDCFSYSNIFNNKNITNNIEPNQTRELMNNMKLIWQTEKRLKLY